MEIRDGILIKVDNKLDIKDGTFVIPKEVTEIGESAFEECDNLISIEIPETVTKIGNGVFWNCGNLTSVKISEGVTEIGATAFYSCENLTSIEIPKTVTSIGKSAFDSCTRLTSIKIEDGITEIRDGTFYNCNSLTSIEIPESVVKIEDNAFERCYSLASVKFGEDITEIGDKAFYDCGSLTSIEIPQSVTSIGDSTFDGCESLTSIKIPEGVTKIGNSAFDGCKSLTSIEIPETVTSIGNSAFNGCDSLTSIKIPESVTKIGDMAFAVSGLKSVEISDSVKEIGNNIFFYNSVEYDKEVQKILLKGEKNAKTGKYIPNSYLRHLFETGEIKTFLETTDFRAFNSNIQNFEELLKYKPYEEELDFFKFAVALGCFSNEKVLDKNSKETEVTKGQKASALLAKLIKTEELKIGNYHRLFNSLPFDARASQEFLRFITPQGKKNDNLELILRLEKNYPGMFVKVMTKFEEIKEFRHTLGDDGRTTTLSWEDALKKFYIETRYTGITEETKDIADSYGSKGLEQNVFDRGVELRQEAKEKGVPHHILGTQIKELSILEQIEQLRQQTEKELGETKPILDDLYSKQFTFEWLDKNDPRNGILGLYVSCCGTITSQFYGKHIAESSIVQKDVQNLVVKDARGEIISKGTLYVNEELGYGVFNDFELNEKYREHEDRSNGYGGIYAGDEKEESQLSESEKRQREEKDLIFAAFQRGMQAFIEEYNKQHPDKPIKQINVGMGYNRLKRNVMQFEEATELLTVPTEYGFEDASRQQYVLYKREEKDIGENNKNVEENIR